MQLRSNYGSAREIFQDDAGLVDLSELSHYRSPSLSTIAAAELQM